MKRYIAIVSLLICFCSVLCGCGFWMDGDYVSVVPHQDQSNSPEEEVIEVSTYRQMCNALAELVESGAESGIISATAFNSGSVRFYMDSAIQNVLTSNAVGAYAVDEITYEVGTRSGAEAIALDIQYEHDLSEILRINQAKDMAEAKDVIEEALKNCDLSVVVQIGQYEETDFVQLVRDYANDNPDIIMEIPKVTASVYPEKGTERIVELLFTYQTSRDSLRQMQQAVEPVFTAAGLYVKGDAQVRGKYVKLYAFLMERFDYTIETSITPAYSLLSHGVGDCKAFANVYAAMCRKADLECYVVSGTRDGEPWTWNIINFRGSYYHLDLLRSSQLGEFSPKRKSELSGYVWDYSAYPD